MYFHVYSIIFYMVAFHTATGRVDGMQEDDGNSNRTEEIKLEVPVSLMEAIRKAVSRKIDQSLRPFVSSKDSDIQKDERPSTESDQVDPQELLSHTQLLDESILRAIEESVDRNFDEMLPKFLSQSERNSDTVPKKSFADILKSDRPPVIRPVDNSSRSKEPFAVSSQQKRNKETHVSEVIENTGEGRNTNGFSENDRALLLIPKYRTESINVLTELQKAKVNLDDFRVIKKVKFPSGAVLFECKSVKDRENFQKRVTSLDKLRVKKKEQNGRLPTVRVQKIPADVKEEEIREEVLQQFNEYPDAVRFMPYKDGRDHITAVLLVVKYSLLKKINASPYLQVRGSEYSIDTNIYIPRCANCQLIGHLKKFCEFQPRPPPSASEECLDCSYFNEQLRTNEATSERAKFRDVNHQTNANLCPSKLYFIEKRRSEREMYLDAESNDEDKSSDDNLVN